MKIRIVFLLFLAIGVTAQTTQTAQQPTGLFLRGYSVIPTPQQVELQNGDVEFSASWVCDPGALSGNHPAVRSLLQSLKEFHAIELKTAGSQNENVIRLSVTKGTVQTGNDPEIDKQGYLLKITPGLVQLTGNADQGLFYGVQTLLQLLRTDPRGRLGHRG